MLHWLHVDTGIYKVPIFGAKFESLIMIKSNTWGRSFEEKSQPQPLGGIMEPYFWDLKEIQDFEKMAICRYPYLQMAIFVKWEGFFWADFIFIEIKKCILISDEF